MDEVTEFTAAATYIAPPPIELRLDRAQEFLDQLFPSGAVRLTVEEDYRRYQVSRD